MQEVKVSCETGRKTCAILGTCCVGFRPVPSSARRQTKEDIVRFKVKWRKGNDGPLAPEVFDTEDQAKERVRQLLAEHHDMIVDVWNEEETWQIVSPAGVAEWSRA
jgi:hypothetical protein